MAPVHFFDITSKYTGLSERFHSTVFTGTDASIDRSGQIMVSQHVGPSTRRSHYPTLLNDPRLVSVSMKIRIALNYQAVPYAQSYISYPDIRPILESLGHASQKADHSDQTLPAIYHPESLRDKVPGGKVMIESMDIAHHLDGLHPGRSLFPSTPTSSKEQTIELVHKVAGVYQKTFGPGKAMKIAIPKVPGYLDERGADYFLRTRTASHPQKKSPVDWPSKDPEEDWKAYEASLEPIADLLARDSSGPFFLGETFSFADAIAVAHMVWFQRGDEAYLTRIGEMHGGVLGKLFERVNKEGWIDGQGDDKEWPVPQKAAL